MLSVLLFSFLACSTLGKEGGSEDFTYRVNLGQATSYDAQRYIEQILRKYNFQIERSNIGGQIYYETSWLERIPDESESGIQSIQTKITISSRGGRTLATGIRTFTLELSGTTQAIQYIGADWERVPISAYSTNVIDEIAQELKDEFSSRFFGF